MSGEHSPLAPSSAHRWVPCPGSVQLEARYPELEEDEAAAEGTAAHFAGSEVLLGRQAPAGTVAPNGVVLTDEMIEGADLWIEDVLQVADAAGVRNELQVEQRVAIPRVHAECFGTPDTWLYVQAAGELYVWDFKFGHGIVEVFEMWQLITYVCGILDLLGIDGRNDQHLWVTMRVVQPRGHHRDGKVRTWRVKASDLRGYFNRLHAAADEAMHPNPHTQSGPHCLHCRAAAHCQTLKRAAWSAADYLGGSAPDELDVEAAAYELGLLEHIETLVKARKRGRAADVEARLRRGESVPGWLLEPKFGHTTWREGDESLVLIVGDMSEVNLRKTEAPVTPNQAKKLLLAKGVDTSVISEYSHTPRTGVTLARDTNLLNRARAGFGLNLEQ